MASTKDWMSAISPTTQLSGIIMPGSHDAGVAKTNVELNKGSSEAWAACQDGEIYDQAICGSRFFDLRVFFPAEAHELEAYKLNHTVQKIAHMAHQNAFK